MLARSTPATYGREEALVATTTIPTGDGYWIVELPEGLAAQTRVVCIETLDEFTAASHTFFGAPYHGRELNDAMLLWVQEAPEPLA
jgi:hypothetical protein